MSSLLYPCAHGAAPDSAARGLSIAAGQSPGRALRDCVDDLLRQLQCKPWYASLFAAEGGKMFGVLLVRTPQGLAYLAGFSGILDGRWQQQGFVPPVFDISVVSDLLKHGDQAVCAVNTELAQADLPARLQAAREQLAVLQRESGEELDRLRFALARRKRHRALQRENLAAAPAREQQRQLACLNSQSQQDKKKRKTALRCWRQRLDQAQRSLDELLQQHVLLQTRRAEISRATQQRLFEQYRLCNPQGQSSSINRLFAPAQPPAGAGDCAAPRLLHYANRQGYRVLALAEFWVGAAPRSGVRRHGYLYPPCHAKCAPLIPWLAGSAVEYTGRRSVNGTGYAGKLDNSLKIVYQDESVTVIDKPPGLLSTPGKTMPDSVQTRFAALMPAADGPLLVHRLDMDTSGLLLLASNRAAHKALQQQFIRRQVGKRYVALLDGNPEHEQGVIDLPLRVDLDDRPRQLVCSRYGKAATTRYQVLERAAAVSRVAFEPLSGRTHQLRVHAAHSLGLNTPIMGDVLYGRGAERMMLHAESLSFRHPESGEVLTLTCPAPF